MADAAATAPVKKTRKPQGPRKVAPIFVLIGYTNEDGSVVPLDQARLTVEVTKDSAELVAMLTGPQGTGGRVVKTITPPAATKANPAA